MDFDKSDFKKQAPTVSCNACGSEQEKFVLVRNHFQYIEPHPGANLQTWAGRHSPHNWRMDSPNKEISSLIGILRKNIFTEVDKLAEMHSRTYYDMPGNADGNKAFLDFFHYLGDEKSYNQLLISPPNLWEKELREFYTKVYQGIQVIGSQKIDNYVANVAKSLGRGGNGNSWSGHGPNWYTNDTEEDAIANIGQWVKSNISGGIRRGRILGDEIQKMAEYIYSEIGKQDVVKTYKWDVNATKNSLKTLPKPHQLSRQFNDKDVFEGVEYCNHCGAEQSRSLMIETTFKPYSGEKGDEFAIPYLGRIQDIHTDVIPQVEVMWNEQIKELNRRIKRATKRWDAAEERLQKKLEEEEERKRQTEIAKLEKKLNSLKSKGKKD